MIAFASLFLGLIVGTHPVEVLVDETVFAVEYRLDGEVVAHLTAPPWRAEVPLGDELAPHELIATAFDAEGREIGSALQWINMPRSNAEGRLVIDESNDGQSSVARLAFESIETEAPTSTRVLLDGRKIEVPDVTRFDLPPYDPQSLHYLRVELEFGSHTASVVEATFGGTYTDQTTSEQMAVPILVEGETKAGFARELHGQFTKGGQPVRVLGVDEGPAEVILVRDVAAQAHLDEMVRYERQRLNRFNSLRFVAHLKKDQRVRFMEPFVERTERPELTYELFSSSVTYTPRSGGVLWFLLNQRPVQRPATEQRIADAVAVAGMSAMRTNYRRAVVLLLSEEPQDDSRLTPEAVRAYLAALRVPLFVWHVGSNENDAPSRWGEGQEVSSIHRLEREVRHLGRYLEQQRIVWIEGIHLPQTLELAPSRSDLSIAR